MTTNVPPHTIVFSAMSEYASHYDAMNYYDIIINNNNLFITLY